MKLTDITEKKSTYWRTSEKKPRKSKPSKKHQQRHPGQSRGMVGDSVEFDDKPVDEMYDNPEGIVDTMNKSKKNYLQIQLLLSQAQAEGFTSLQDLKDPQNNTTPKKRFELIKDNYGSDVADTVTDSLNDGIERVSDTKQSAVKRGARVEVTDSIAQICETKDMQKYMDKLDGNKKFLEFVEKSGKKLSDLSTKEKLQLIL